MWLAWEKREKHTVLCLKPEGKRALEKPCRSFEDIISGVADTRIYTNKRNIR
jgi:hypothetical protein